MSTFSPTKISVLDVLLLLILVSAYGFELISLNAISNFLVLGFFSILDFHLIYRLVDKRFAIGRRYQVRLVRQRDLRFALSDLTDLELCQ